MGRARRRMDAQPRGGRRGPSNRRGRDKVASCHGSGSLRGVGFSPRRPAVPAAGPTHPYGCTHTITHTHTRTQAHTFSHSLSLPPREREREGPCRVGEASGRPPVYRPGGSREARPRGLFDQWVNSTTLIDQWANSTTRQ